MDPKVREAIESFDIPNPLLHLPRRKAPSERMMYYFELCADYDELEATLHSINHLGYDLVSATQDGRGVYTLFFGRPPE